MTQVNSKKKVAFVDYSQNVYSQNKLSTITNEGLDAMLNNSLLKIHQYVEMIDLLFTHF